MPLIKYNSRAYILVAGVRLNPGYTKVTNEQLELLKQQPGFMSRVGLFMMEVFDDREQPIDVFAKKEEPKQEVKEPVKEIKTEESEELEEDTKKKKGKK